MTPLGFRPPHPRLIPPREISVAKRSREEMLSDIEALARSLEPALRAAILAYLTLTKDEVPMKAILAALKEGNTAKVLDLIADIDAGAAKEGVQDAIRTAAWAGAAAAAASINLRLRGATFVFDKLNPQLIQWLQGYSLNLIRQIDAQTKESVRAALIEGMQKGQNPVATARDVKQAVGLTTKQAKAVSNFRAQLETFHLRGSAKGWNLGGKIDRVNGRQVFKPDADGTPLDGIDERRLRDFRFDPALKKAMETGKPLTPAQIDKMVAAYERKYLRYRSEVIARTEALRTTNQGVQEAWRQAIQTGKADAALVRRSWIVSKDERTCFPAGVQVETPSGPVDIAAVRPGDMVLTAAGAARRVLATRAQLWSGSLRFLVLAGGRVLVCTPEHLIHGPGGWREAQDFAPGDFVDTLGNQTAQVVRAFDLGFLQPRDAPPTGSEEGVLPSVFGRVAVPVGTVSLDGNVVPDQGEVDGVAPYAVLLGEGGTVSGEGLAHLGFDAGFPAAAPVAGDRAEPRSGARGVAEGVAAALAGTDGGRAPASLRAEPSLLIPPGGEALAASRAVGIECSGKPASARADGVSVGGGGRDREGASADGTDLADTLRAGVVAGPVAVAVAALESRTGDVVLTAAGGAGDGHLADCSLVVALAPAEDPALRPLLAEKLAAALRALAGEGHSINLDALSALFIDGKLAVFDLQIEHDEEFVANGVRVHNCEVCAPIPGLNPKRGVRMDEPFKTPKGPVMLPPAHPQCRCVVFIRQFEPSQIAKG